jgi:HAE1 family hydrophobic/amphiphilic exporter-1
VSSKNGIKFVYDIADVQDGQKTAEKIARSKSAIILQIVKQSDANAVAVSV